MKPMDLGAARASTSLPAALGQRIEPTPEAKPLLKVEELSLSRGESLILDNVTFSLRRGGTLGLLGESGAGKSTIALTLIGLLRTPEVGLSGTIELDGAGNVTEAGEDAWLKLRGRRVAMNFQDASQMFHCLNCDELTDFEQPDFDNEEDYLAWKVDKERLKVGRTTKVRRGRSP